MSILTTDLKKYAAASMPENDTGTTGGAIDTAVKLAEFIQASNTIPKVVSSSASDTAATTLTLTGRDAAGAITSEAKTLNGTTQVAFTVTFERILKAVLTGTTTVGNITIFMNDGTTTIVVIPLGKTTNRRMFYDAASGAGVVTLYEKEFWKNEHATLTLTNATMTLTADTGDANHDFQIGLENSANDTSTNRKTAPTSVTFVDNSVATAAFSLAAAAGKGVWIRLTLAASATAQKGTFTTQLSGSST